jgi:prepilin-type N-terminal cleavage/methylation domain-containing protein
MSKNKNSGFTLAEMLIALMIIGFLVTIGISSYSQSIKSSRDATRKADLQTISLALEKFKNDYDSYPTNITTSISPRYLNVVPTDPKTKIPYKYEGSPNGCVISTPCTNYILTATLEISGTYSIDKYGIR